MWVKQVYRTQYFEKVIKPLHQESEAGLKDYYHLFYEILKEIQKHDASLNYMNIESRAIINQIYHTGKPRRDLIRAICQSMSENAKHARIRSYCDSLNLIFSSIVDVGPRKMSAGKIMIDIMDVCLADNLNDAPFRYQRAIDLQIELIENRWIAANQIYALLFVKAYKI